MGFGHTVTLQEGGGGQIMVSFYSGRGRGDCWYKKRVLGEFIVNIKIRDMGRAIQRKKNSVMH